MCTLNPTRLLGRAGRGGSTRRKRKIKHTKPFAEKSDGIGREFYKLNAKC